MADAIHSKTTAIIDQVTTCEPLTPLTPAEIEFIVNTVDEMPREAVLARLQADLQTACEIELATIPIYLYTYYSLNRAPTTGLDIDDKMLFANKAGRHIMSVAVEEMLHMSLSANIYFAMFGQSPKLYGKSPDLYPTPLPYHNPIGPKGPKGEADAEVKIPLGKFGYEQLWHFLQIEYPESRTAKPKDRNWDTIGQFYSYIRCLFCSGQLTDADFQVGSTSFQIQPYNYSPNNIDTVSPDKRFNPYVPVNADNSGAGAAAFSNQPGSHAGPSQLMTVSSRLDAMLAIDTICDQGEGFYHTAYDNPAHTEESHYYKFLSLQAQLQPYQHRVEELPEEPAPPAELIQPAMCEKELLNAGLIFNFPDNPKVSGYQSQLEKAVADFCNGLYQYMLMMTETIFEVEAEPELPAEQQSQKWYFNVALHRSMIWVLDKYIQTMRKIELVDANGNKTGQNLAPSFEFINLGTPQEAFSNLKTLGNNAIAATANTPIGKDIQYYVDVAVNQKSGSNSMHLPDIADFIKGNNNEKAAREESQSFAAAPAFPAQVQEQPPGAEIHACMGLNSCKGSDRFGRFGPNGNDPNACAGQGFCSTATDHNCHVSNDCRNQGGCGLYGDAHEVSNPGRNECRSLGSCATPINAERFITTGPYRGTSVWHRARQAFHEQIWPELRKQNPDLPEQLPAVGGKEFVEKHGDLFKDGPAYVWILNNGENSDIVACGSSGMSGAGGCS